MNNPIERFEVERGILPTYSTHSSKLAIDRQMEQILIAVERLEKQLESLKLPERVSRLYRGQKDEDLEILLNEAFEDGYRQGYDDGAEDVYNARLAEITE